MKISKQELKQIIREEFMRGVPEFMVRQASIDCIEVLRQHIQKFIGLRAQNPTQAREMLQSANEVLKELEVEMNRLIEDKLWKFLNTT